MAPPTGQAAVPVAGTPVTMAIAGSASTPSAAAPKQAANATVSQTAAVAVTSAHVNTTSSNNNGSVAKVTATAIQGAAPRLVAAQAQAASATAAQTTAATIATAQVNASHKIQATTARTTQPKDAAKENEMPQTLEGMILPSLHRLTQGIPNTELRLIVSEATSCEQALREELRLLEKELEPNNGQPPNPLVDTMLQSEFTPPDLHSTVSALLGRLREPLATPLPPNSSLPAHRNKRRQSQQAAGEPKKKKASTKSNSAANATFASLLFNDGESQDPLHVLQEQFRVTDHPHYRKSREAPVLLAIWKKINTHRTSLVFRRPVSSKDAPGYDQRILFPIDLSLVRKMITSRVVSSFADLHIRIGMICHNCMKYNGRESDYGVVTRDFEAMVDDLILQAVYNEIKKSAAKS